MKITGTKSYVDIEHNGKTARFWGDLCLHGFAAIASTMEWISPNSCEIVNEDERNAFISEVKKYCKRGKNKIRFTDDNGRKI